MYWHCGFRFRATDCTTHIREYKMLIYQAHNQETNKYYVGKTTKTLEKRIHQHYNDTKLDRLTYFHKALKKYSPSSFTWDILAETSSLEELNNLERYWINLLHSKGLLLYNMREGGDGGSLPGKLSHNYGKVLSTVTKQAISKSLHEYYENRPGTMTGRPSPQTGKPRTSEEKKKISDSKRGRSSPNTRGHLNNSARSIICETTGEIFSTASEVANTYNIDLSSIIKCCRGKRKTAGGKSFSYK
jgi:group I intron endonuclease